MENNRKVTAEELIAEMHRTVDRLAADGADRGDIKLLARALRETRHSFRIFAGLRAYRKVIVFGSARCSPDSPSYRQAVAFGRAMARSGWMVVTGAGSGIMEAANVGAGQEHSAGINILLPFEQAPNRIVAGNANLVNVKYFFTRKLLFVKEADGVALFPGGFGTLDESFEVLTLVQTGKSRPFPVVFVDEPGGDYWRKVTRFLEEELLRRGLISPEDLALFRVTDDASVAAAEILGFYRVFHSMRTVGKELVIRLSRPIPEAALARIGREFSDIVSSGTFRLGGCLPDETDEPGLNGLPRLIFRFNRKEYGRLRMLIDALNREGASEIPGKAERSA